MAALRSACRITSTVVIVLVALLAIVIGSYPHKELKLDWEGTILPLAKKYADDNSDSYSTATATTPLGGKVVVITGCTSGIGLSLTRALSRLGATVIGIGRSEERLARLQEQLPAGTFHPVRADFNNLLTVARAADEIVSKWDRIDMLCNNAGMHDNFSNILGDKVSEQGFDRVFAVNYLSHFLLTEKLAATLHNATKPTVLQITSTFHWLVDGSDLVAGRGGGKDMPIAARPGGSTGFFVFRAYRSYSNSKLAQIYHARALRTKHALLSSPKVRLVSACPAWVGTNIGGQPGDLFHTILQTMGFPGDGWGIASALVALLDYPSTSTTTEEPLSYPDYYLNTDFMKVLNVLFGQHDLPSWFSATGIRDVVIFCLAMAAFWLQRLSPNASPAISSPESYNTTIADSLYDWSFQTIQEYL